MIEVVSFRIVYRQRWLHSALGCLMIRLGQRPYHAGWWIINALQVLCNTLYTPHIVRVNWKIFSRKTLFSQSARLLLDLGLNLDSFLGTEMSWGALLVKFEAVASCHLPPYSTSLIWLLATYIFARACKSLPTIAPATTFCVLTPPLLDEQNRSSWWICYLRSILVKTLQVLTSSNIRRCPIAEP